MDSSYVYTRECRSIPNSVEMSSTQVSWHTTVKSVNVNDFIKNLAQLWTSLVSKSRNFCDYLDWCMFVYEDTTFKAKIYISNHSTHEQSCNNCYNLPSEGSEHLLSLRLIVELYFSQQMGSKYLLWIKKKSWA